MKLSRFWSYFGGKWRIAKLYPKPAYGSIIEPFAGSAGYATNYADRKVILYDANPLIIGVWHYLIKVKESEFRKLPTHVPHIDSINVCQEAKHLIGFWMGGPTPRPIKQDRYYKEDEHKEGFWNVRVLNRLASQLRYIRHWKAHCRLYRQIENNPKATWFIDPPYQGSLGKCYTCQIADYNHLFDWTLDRKGQVIVCEGGEAEWLPFKPLLTEKKSAIFGKGERKVKMEMIWSRGNKPFGFNLHGG